MKKLLILVTLVMIVFCACTPSTNQVATGNETHEAIDDTSSSAVMSSVPENDNALEPYADVRGINETMRVGQGEYMPEHIITYWYNKNTIFEGNEDIAARIMEKGKDPGLRVSQLHQQGITGDSVTLAIIDQPMLLDHPEYAGKIAGYHKIGLADKDSPSSMHGPAVTSLLAGETIGTAPGVKIYYVALAFWNGDAAQGAEALDWLVEQNNQLPEGEKIRAVSVSADFTNTEYFINHDAWHAAIERAQAAGILVLDCRPDYETCVFWPSYFDPDERDDITLSRIGNPNGNFLDRPSQSLGTPVGYRTTAEIYSDGIPSYSYDAEGGHSWAVPYGAGILALGWQVNPSLTGNELIELLWQTAYKDEAGTPFLDPSAFIEAVKSTLQ